MGHRSVDPPNSSKIIRWLGARPDPNNRYVNYLTDVFKVKNPEQMTLLSFISKKGKVAYQQFPLDKILLTLWSKIIQMFIKGNPITVDKTPLLFYMNIFRGTSYKTRFFGWSQWIRPLQTREPSPRFLTACVVTLFRVALRENISSHNLTFDVKLFSDYM